MYILDTNTVSTIFRTSDPSTPLNARLLLTPYENLWVTIVTAEELIEGVFKLIRKTDQDKPQNQRKLINDYDFLQRILDSVNKYQILHFDEAAYNIYQKIPDKIKKLVKVRDCRIASIAVACDYTVITNNIRDYKRIQEAIPVKFEDWTVAV